MQISANQRFFSGGGWQPEGGPDCSVQRPSHEPSSQSQSQAQAQSQCCWQTILFSFFFREGEGEGELGRTGAHHSQKVEKCRRAAVDKPTHPFCPRQQQQHQGSKLHHPHARTAGIQVRLCLTPPPATSKSVSEKPCGRFRSTCTLCALTADGLAPCDWSALV